MTELESINRGEEMLEERDREGHVPKCSLRAMEDKEEEKRKKVKVEIYVCGICKRNGMYHQVFTKVPYIKFY